MAASARRRGRTLRLLLVLALVAGGLLAAGGGAAAQEAPEQPEPQPEEEVLYRLVFPVAGNHSYTDTWGAPRSGGRTHKGTDIFAAKGTAVVAAAAGTVVRISIGKLAGRYIVVEHDGGWRTYYLHLNNDSEGTDDGLLDEGVPGVEVGASVAPGDVLDYVGDSGNAEETPPHLHFEIHLPDGTAINPYPHLRAAEGAPADVSGTAQLAVEPKFVGENVALVGRLDPGGGFAADVAAHAGVAYMGTWGRPQQCPASGVRMIDVTDPAEPTLLGTIASGDEFPRTSTDSVWVGAVDTEAFTGDLAAVAVRLCDTRERARRRDAFRGLALYDVTDPAEPELLGTVSSGARTQGIHELDVVVRADGSLLAAVTVLQSLRHTEGASGDLRLIDLTDPTAPIELADWDLRRDGPSTEVDAMMAEVYDDLELHAHSATWSDGGNQLWVANWDAGVTLLDTTDPTRPARETTFGFDPATDGNAHSVTIDPEAGLLIRSDQDLINADFERHGVGWGGQRFYDVSRPDRVTEVARFKTERSMSDEDTGAALHVDGRYSAHTAEVVDGIEYAAWYSDGLRIVDVTDPADPTEVGSFVPPGSVDPQGYWDAPDGNRSFAMVWGVDVADGLIYVSDMHSGLWIVRYLTPLTAAEAAGRIPL